MTPSPALADLHAAAENIWLACAARWPTLSLEVSPQLASTNTTLLNRGRQGDTSLCLLAAVHQTAGRGRQGRHWQANPGGSLTFSLGLPLRLDEVPGGGSALSLAVGLALAQGIDAALAHALGVPHRAPPTTLKWPNDLWREGRKLGGILIEASQAPGLAPGQRWVVIGVGINVQHASAPPGAAAIDEWLTPGPQATSLSAGALWASLAPPLIDAVQQFETQGFAPLQQAYARRDALLGQTVGLWTHPAQGPLQGGPPDQTGVAQGVSASGALLVHTGHTSQSWTTGEVSVRLQAD